MDLCPFLPVPDRDHTHHDVLGLGHDRSERFYQTTLYYGQTLWLEGFPAKAILQVNRAFSTYLPDVSLNTDFARPYHAKAWILIHRPADRFIGNPRRHYQHLATRMVEPHKELRTWRAWACWYLARLVLPESEFPPDTKQVREELVVKPRRQEIADHLKRLSPSDDLAAWEAALAWAQPWAVRKSQPPGGEVAFRKIGPEELGTVRALAHEIWPAVYPSIITTEQIHYMLERMYDPDVLRQELVVRGMVYGLIESAGQPIGYYGFEIVPQQERVLVLHRLYVRPEHHGHGVGAAALRYLEGEARQQNCRAISLRVNRDNVTAIRAYLRQGFVFDHDLRTDIGSGFVMDDHVLRKDLP